MEAISPVDAVLSGLVSEIEAVAVAVSDRLPTVTAPCLTTIITTHGPGPRGRPVKASSLVPPPRGRSKTSAPVPVMLTFFLPTTCTDSWRFAST